MAQTLYLNNGKSIVLMSDRGNTNARAQEFARMLWENLGSDAEQEFLRIVKQVEADVKSNMEDGQPLLP